MGSRIEEDEIGNLDLPGPDLAERYVLGGMLRWPDAADEVVQAVSAEDFRKDAHQKIFAALVDLYERGKPVDLAILANHLSARKQIEDVGGYPYLHELWDGCPTGANALHNAQQVREDSIVRKLEIVGHAISSDARARIGPATELLESAERRIYDIAEVGFAGQAMSLTECMAEEFEILDARCRDGPGESGGVATGFLDLDYKLSGLRASELVVLAARPSVGKSALGTQIAVNAGLSGVAVFFVSLEMSRVELAERMLCCEGQVDGHHVRKGCLSSADMDRLTEAYGRLRKAKVFIDDTPQQSMLRITANARRLKRKHGVGLIVVDYLQMVEPSNRKEPRHEQVGGVSRRLKILARELQVPVLAIAQLNRAVEDRASSKPRLSDLRESGSIEADADTVLLMHAPDVASGAGQIMELNVGKQRNGPTGEVTLIFRKEFVRFENFGLDRNDHA